MNAPARIETGIVDIRGKQYETVALRVQKFRAAHPDKSLTTEMIVRDDECVVMRAIIADEAGRVLATGHSEEYRKASQINRTSALENAETSAIGRALAAYGFGGTEFATANEVANAIHQQGAGGQSQGGTVSPQPPITDEQLVKLQMLLQATASNVKAFCDYFKVAKVEQLPANAFGRAVELLENKLAEAAKAETAAKAKENA